MWMSINYHYHHIHWLIDLLSFRSFPLRSAFLSLILQVTAVNSNSQSVNRVAEQAVFSQHTNPMCVCVLNVSVCRWFFSSQWSNQAHCVLFVCWESLPVHTLKREIETETVQVVLCFVPLFSLVLSPFFPFCTPIKRSILELNKCVFGCCCCCRAVMINRLA